MGRKTGELVGNLLGAETSLPTNSIYIEYILSCSGTYYQTCARVINDEGSQHFAYSGCRAPEVQIKIHMLYCNKII